jgi:Flp pilus assembly protein TadG
MRRPLGTKTAADFAISLWRDQDGIILPYVTVMLVVIIGVAVLAIDGARLMSLQTQLQSGADALALTGAAELDRLPDAEMRAREAMTKLIANSTLFGTSSNRSVEISQVAFYSRLPESDDSPMTQAAPAAEATAARFLSVTVKPVSLNTILPAAVFGGSSTVSAGASAVAGFDQAICQGTPLFVCNPYEQPGMGYSEASRSLETSESQAAIRRRLIRLRQHGNSDNPYAAGDYGFLDASTIPTGTSGTLDALASARPAACFVQNGVAFRPAFLANARDAFNVRFDMYEGSMSGRQNDPDFRPSLNVRKGYVGGGGGANAGNCGATPGTNWPIGSPPNQASGLPLDLEWPFMNGRMGNGLWDFSTYWQVNHGADGRPPPLVNGEAATNADPPSRYEVYRYEIEHGYVADRSAGGESGAPACYGGGALSDAPDRRVLYAAIINCQSLSLRGGVEASTPVAAFGKFFLTLPLQGSQTDLYVEAIGLIRPGDRADFEMVQLYR